MDKPLFPGGTLALMSNPVHQALREKISGVYAAATRHGWQVFQTAQGPTAAAIRKITAMVRPIGFVIDPLQLTRAIPPGIFGETPVVLMGRDTNRRAQVFDCSCQDTAQPVDAALGVFQSLGDFASFAFVGHPAREAWSRERGELFAARAARLAPFFQYGGRDPESGRGGGELVAWLRGLPKPAGLFLATDHIAPAVFAAIRRAGVAVPGEMAVVSVDDIREICENVHPNLTSVGLNFFRCGENAVELLRRRLQKPSRPLETLAYGVTAVSRRASTRRPYTDSRVTRAVEFIEGNLAARISARHVVEAMGCGRRQAEQLFRRHTGLSILQAIQRRRIEKAMALVQGGDIPLAEIPAFCGYDSAAFFKTIFRRETGMTMRAWRRRGSLNPPSGG